MPPHTTATDYDTSAPPGGRIVIAVIVLPKSPFAMAHPVAMPVAAHGLPAVPSHFSRSLLFICLSLHVPPLGIGRHLLVFRLCLHVPPLGSPRHLLVFRLS